MILHCASRQLDLSTPQVMGILNVTPDSFSDGGRFEQLDAALRQAERMSGEGAAIIDVGGESTRPGAEAVDAQTEMERVLPVIERLVAELDVVISVDTSKPEVMRAAVAAGAHLINDVRALREEGALEAAASTDAAVCLMHMQGEPRTMQTEPRYDDVVGEVVDFLYSRAGDCRDAGIGRDRLVVDPGFGFGKDLGHNLALLAHMGRVADLGYPVLAGLSRKSMFGKLLHRDLEQRLPASIAAATVAAMRGARILRVHDVSETMDAMRLIAALNQTEAVDD